MDKLLSLQIKFLLGFWLLNCLLYAQYLTGTGCGCLAHSCVRQEIRRSFKILYVDETSHALLPFYDQLPHTKDVAITCCCYRCAACQEAAQLQKMPLTTPQIPILQLSLLLKDAMRSPEYIALSPEQKVALAINATDKKAFVSDWLSKKS
jgi:hypothetical protein